MLLPKPYCDAMKLPSERFVELTEFRGLTTDSFAIIFILAKWSMASQVSFRALNDVVSMSSRQDFIIYIVDTDLPIANEIYSLSDGVRGGYGEVFIVNSGNLETQLDLRNDECRKILRLLLEEYQ